MDRRTGRCPRRGGGRGSNSDPFSEAHTPVVWSQFFLRLFAQCDFLIDVVRLGTVSEGASMR